MVVLERTGKEKVCLDSDGENGLNEPDSPLDYSPNSSTFLSSLFGARRELYRHQFGLEDNIVSNDNVSQARTLESQSVASRRNRVHQRNETRNGESSHTSRNASTENTNRHHFLNFGRRNSADVNSLVLDFQNNESEMSHVIPTSTRISVPIPNSVTGSSFHLMLSDELPPAPIPRRNGNGRKRPRAEGRAQILTSSIHSVSDSRRIAPRNTTIASCHSDPVTFSPLMLTFKEAVAAMSTFDINRHSSLIKTTLCKFSFRIYGLEDCSSRDLQLAVFFFLEEHFYIQPVIELCVRHIPDTVDPNVVGVVFEWMSTAQAVLRRTDMLKNTNYTIKRNNDASWIVMNYDS